MEWINYTYSVGEKIAENDDGCERYVYQHWDTCQEDPNYFMPYLAHDYYYDQGGWEWGHEWEKGDGVVFYVWKPDGTYWGKFNMKIEYKPQFYLDAEDTDNG